MTSYTVSRLVLVTFAAAVLIPEVLAQAPKSSESLPLEEVVKLAKEGFSEELIVTRIKKNGKSFDLSAEELVELKKMGISETIIKFLMDPSQPYAPPPPPAPAPAPSGPRPENSNPTPPPAPRAPLKQYPADPHASKVPPEPGLYRFPGEAPVKVDIQILLGTKEGPGLGKVLMKKGKIVAYVVGPESRTRIKEPSPVFYVRLPEGKAIEEIVLLAFDRKSERREIEMGLKQELNPEDRRQFDALEVAAGVFKLTTAKLTKGEYLFFLLGSAEPPKGSYGKGFDFGIDEPPSKR